MISQKALLSRQPLSSFAVGKTKDSNSQRKATGSIKANDNTSSTSKSDLAQGGETSNRSCKSLIETSLFWDSKWITHLV